MRVAHICDAFIHGGIEYVIRDLCLTLQDYQVESSIFVLYGNKGTTNSSSRFLNQLPFEVVPLGMNPRMRLDPWCILRLRQALLRFRPDVVHCHSYYAGLAALLLRRIGLCVPIVHTVHADLYRGLQRSDSIISWVIRSCDRVIATSHHTAATVESFTNGCVHPTPILLGIDLARTPPVDAETRNASRKHLRIDNDTLIILMVARLTTQKDHPTLFRAFAQALPSLGNARLFVVGGGVERDRLEDLVISLGMVNKIVFFGDVPDISVYLSAADIFVLSTCNEGFGISVIEACCAGLPVVATALGPLKDLHQAGLNLVLTKPGDVESLRDSLLSLANPTTRMCLGRQLRDLAPLLFSMERTARQYLAVYDELLAIKKPTRRELGTITRKPAESLANLK